MAEGIILDTQFRKMTLLLAHHLLSSPLPHQYIGIPKDTILNMHTK